MNDFSPLVSVIIPLYNAEKYIRDTLLSVANQTYKNYEVIVVDNASTDSSLDIVNEFTHTIHSLVVIQCEQNSGGPACPRNIGIDNSQGEYIAFLDSDDVWLENKLDLQVKFMRENCLNFTCTNKVFIDDESRTLTRKIDIIFKTRFGRYTLRDLILRNNITTSSVVVSRDLLGLNKFSELKVLNCVEDYLLWLTLISKGECEFFHMKEGLVRYRLFNHSLSKSDGGKLILVKSMLASCCFMVESNNFKYFPHSLFSHFIRFLLLRLR